MIFFGKQLREYARFARVGVVLILLVGLARFIVGVSGVPYERATHLVSLTITTSGLAIVYGARGAARRCGRHRQPPPPRALRAPPTHGLSIPRHLLEGRRRTHGEL